MQECKQCGLLHPALDPGATCPMASKDKTEEQIIKKEPNEVLFKPLPTTIVETPVIKNDFEVYFESLFEKIKNICNSQFEKKKVKNKRHLFSKIILSVMKTIEEYKE